MARENPYAMSKLVDQTVGSLVRKATGSVSRLGLLRCSSTHVPCVCAYVCVCWECLCVHTCSCVRACVHVKCFCMHVCPK